MFGSLLHRSKELDSNEPAASAPIRVALSLEDPNVPVTSIEDLFLMWHFKAAVKRSA
jgi:hypothetical protein